MCDYSLASVPNRLAVEGEQLVTFRFITGSMGLRSGDAPRWRLWFMQPPDVCVCVPPGARLLLRDISADLQRQLDVRATEEVTFGNQAHRGFRGCRGQRAAAREPLLLWGSELSGRASHS
jgi:hypothetical protein